LIFCSPHVYSFLYHENWNGNSFEIFNEGGNDICTCLRCLFLFPEICNQGLLHFISLKLNSLHLSINVIENYGLFNICLSRRKFNAFYRSISISPSVNNNWAYVMLLYVSDLDATSVSRINGDIISGYNLWSGICDICHIGANRSETI
jgi:hypothetical protein